MLLLVLSALVGQASPQSWPTDTARRAPVVAAADSIRLLRSARSAQSSFELFRRIRLPVGGHSVGTCEIRIGRYCYWRGDDEDDKPPPPEAPAIGARREQLLKELDSTAHLIAGDAWVAGQFVRYLVEAGRIDDAWQFATNDCRGTATWCAALAGYAAHSGQRFASADSAFAVSLSSMEPAERCRWLDPSYLMDGELARRFDHLDCAGRESFARQLFWLGAPLYSVSATDLLTEHLARVTRARIAEHAATVDGQSWADDLRELMTRYGWPRWYSRSMPEFGSQREASITGHDAGVPYNYLPTLHALEHVGELNAEDWKLDDPRALHRICAVVRALDARRAQSGRAFSPRRFDARRGRVGRTSRHDAARSTPGCRARRGSARGSRHDRTNERCEGRWPSRGNGIGRLGSGQPRATRQGGSSRRTRSRRRCAADSRANRAFRSSTLFVDGGRRQRSSVPFVTARSRAATFRRPKRSVCSGRRTGCVRRASRFISA